MNAADFDRDVVPAEREEIAKRRAALNLPPPDDDVVGLAISGGGIRSATFSLGAVQALHDYGAFGSFDYLSTVSGGGFTGSCISSLMNDSAVRPDDTTFPLRTVTGANEPDAVRHLRNSGNYLAPGGMLDKVRIPALVIRGVLLNLLAVMPYLMLAVVATQYYYDSYLGGPESLTKMLLQTAFEDLPWVAFAMALLLFPLVSRLLANRLSWSARNRGAAIMTGGFLVFLIWSLRWTFASLVEAAINTTFPRFQDQIIATINDPSFRWRAIALIAIVAIGALLAGRSATGAKIRSGLALYTLGFLGPLIVVAIYLLLCMAEIEPYRLNDTVATARVTPRAIRDLDNGVLAPELARTIPANALSGWVETHETGDEKVVAAYGNVYRVVNREGARAWIEAASASADRPDVEIDALHGGHVPPSLNFMFHDNNHILALREARVTERTPGSEWMAVHPDGSRFAIVRHEDTLTVFWDLPAPPAYRQDATLGIRAYVRPIEPGRRWEVVSSGCFYRIDRHDSELVVRANLAADLSRHLLSAAVRNAFDSKGGLSEKAATTIDPGVPMAADVAFAASGPDAVHTWHINDPGRGRLVEVNRADDGYDTDLRPPFMDGAEDRLFFGAAIVWLLFNAMFANVNASSIHDFYRDRLSKAYLLRRNKNGELEQNDRQRLAALREDGSTAPYHLINASLNLNGSTEPDMRGRNSDFFVFSKHFTGSVRTGYCKTADLERVHRHLDLGTAMAISGAAAAPNAGTTTIKPLTFLLTLFNIRLGYWMPHPAYVSSSMWQRIRLSFGVGPRYLWREAMGALTTKLPYVNLSDGGHIENLGLYALLKRRCKVIVAIDGEQDEQLRFGSLMQLLMYARIDLGINITIDLDRIHAASGTSESHFTIGDIDYGNGHKGSLIYMKASVTGDEGPLVLDYRESNPDFPHQSTTNQFFSERQFEMYRALGFHVAEGMCVDLVKHDGIAPLLFRMALRPAASVV
ncbi:MAG TPA: patatin-like phospholipase family protein [Vicinamibacterales bacterium]|nr:patatin-like phospholipase family protein [Vicinamibacterales bacterium]